MFWLKFKVIMIMLLSTYAFGNVYSQETGLIYRERSLNRNQSPQLFYHQGGAILYLAVSGLGIYTLSKSSLAPIEIANMQNASGFEGQYLCDCLEGDFLLHQRGFLGNRLVRLDGLGSAQVITPGDGEVTDVRLIGGGATTCEIKDSSGVITKYATLDCGRTWFADSGNPETILSGAVLLEHQNPFRYTIARDGLGNVSYPSSIKSKSYAGLSSIALLGKDSLVWISRRNRSPQPDTIWYADIRDSSMIRYDTVLHVSGVADSIRMNDVKLVATSGGSIFLFHRTGWYARYAGSTWTVIDTLPIMGTMDFTNTSSQSSIINDVLWYVSSSKTGHKLVMLVLDSISHPSKIFSPDPLLSNLWGLRSLSPESSTVSFQKASGSFCLYTDSGDLQVIGSAVREIEDLSVIPIQFGFTSEAGEPIVVPFSDCAVLVTKSGIGILRSSNVRGEVKWGTRLMGPIIQSNRGLRVPFVGNGEVISPGNRVRQFTRSGRFVKDVYNQPATAVCRMEDSTLVVGDGAKITVLPPSGTRDSVDITTSLCESVDSSGFVNSIIASSEGTLLAFVNGLRFYDLETLETRPWKCGGVLRSRDAGHTWTRSVLPVESPYFLGSIRTPTGALVTSVSTLVRDTTTHTPPGLNEPLESLNHTFSDRTILRSTDDGVTWVQVYHTTSNRSFELIGGDGVIAKSGTLLLMTTDGVLQSTNDGLEWDFHEIQGMDAGTQVISMFQDSVASEVYYCTSNGLYIEQRETSVHEERLSEPKVHVARAWRDHLSWWKLNGKVLKRLFSVFGEDVLQENPPSGMYMAEYEYQSELRMEPIIVLAE